MAERIDAPAFSEPEMISAPLLDGCELEVGDDFMKVAGWVETSPLNPGEPPERRIVVRAVLPTTLVRELIKEAQRLLARGGH